MVSTQVDEKKVRRLLTEFANAKPADQAAMQRWLKFYRSALPLNFFSDIEAVERRDNEKCREELGADTIWADLTPDEAKDSALMRLWDLGYKLRRAWDEPNVEAREWYIDELRRWMYVLTEPNRAKQMPLPPPTPTGIQEALRYFRNNADMARHCPNPNCATPYFFASDRRDKFCDDECADWAKRRSKMVSARKRRAGTGKKGKK